MTSQVTIFSEVSLYPFDIISDETDFGDIGLHGELGYGHASVINIWRFPWVLSAHASSTVKIFVREPVQVWGFLNGTAFHCNGAYFQINEINLGAVHRAYDLVGPSELPVGQYTLTIRADNQSFCHTVWGFSRPSHVAISPKFYLTIGALCKNENDYLEEWLKHHRNLGVDHFFILDNESQYPLKETVKHTKYSPDVTIQNFNTSNSNPKNRAYSYLFQKFGPMTKWMAILDIDEFLNPLIPIAFKRYLQSFESFGGIEVPWMMFGSSGLLHRPEPQLESYTNSYLNPHVKTIVQPRFVSFGINPQTFEYLPNRAAVGEQYDENRTAKYIQINRYWTRSMAEWQEKMVRGAPCTGCERSLQDFERHQLNCSYEDLQIQYLDQRIAESEIQPCPNRPVVGFIHVAAINHWQGVLTDQLHKVCQSGLYDITEAIHIGIVGGESSEIEDKLGFLPSKCKVLFIYSKLEHFEFPTLLELERQCRSKERYVWYVHSKGVTNWSIASERWRARMEGFVICQWELCLKRLMNGYTAAGTFTGNVAKWIIPGNFWWASSEHIKALPSLESLDQNDRFECERWIGISGVDNIYFHDKGDTVFDTFEIVKQQSGEGRCSTNGWHGFQDIKVLAPKNAKASNLIATHAPSTIELLVKQPLYIFGFICLSGGNDSCAEFFVNNTPIGFVKGAGNRTMNSDKLVPGTYELNISDKGSEHSGCHTVWGVVVPSVS